MTHRSIGRAALACAAAMSFGALFVGPGAEAGAVGPHFTNTFEATYVSGDVIHVTGSGCPASGGAPSNVSPSVMLAVGGHLEDATVTGLAGAPDVIAGEVTYYSGFNGHSMNVVVPVEADGTWSVDLELNPPSAPTSSAVHGVCTSLVELAADGQAIDPASEDAASFQSPPFLILYSTLDSTTTTTSTTTSTVPPPVVATPTYTG